MCQPCHIIVGNMEKNVHTSTSYNTIFVII
jgi:hypothetical protein